MAGKKTKKKKAGATEGALPGSARELAQRVFAQRDPVAVFCDLLGAESESVRARIIEHLVELAYGKPSGSGGNASPAAPAVRFIWDLPRPPYEKPTDA